ncbi:MAG TPA: DUF4124 domain-containing protein [Burkholderiales bacterium]|nr:DUF4124 domain-containing protein [Burkholderiales bacterium]
MKLPVRLTFLTVALACSSLTFAQTIYKYQSHDGRTVYSDKLPHGTKAQKELAPDSALSVVPPPLATADTGKADQRIATQLSRRDQLWQERKMALARLQAARSAKADGEEPQAGERTGRVGGGSRLNDAYWARQGRLQHEIDTAQRDLDRAERSLREAGS